MLYLYFRKSLSLKHASLKIRIVNFRLKSFSYDSNFIILTLIKMIALEYFSGQCLKRIASALFFYITCYKTIISRKRVVIHIYVSIYASFKYLRVAKDQTLPATLMYLHHYLLYFGTTSIQYQIDQQVFEGPLLH